MLSSLSLGIAINLQEKAITASFLGLFSIELR
jgi:hypothetical protein